MKLTTTVPWNHSIAVVSW